MASDSAFMKNGSKVMPPSICVFNFWRSAIRFVQSASSENVNVGTDSDAVIVFVMAFFMPTIFFTWSPAFGGASGG